MHAIRKAFLAITTIGALLFAGMASFPALAQSAQNIQSVQRLFVTYFARPADPIALNFFASQLAGGTSTATLANSFGASSEYVSSLQGLSNAQIVNKLYLNMFGHAPDGNASIFWTSRLDSNVFNRTTVATAIADSALGADLTALTNKIVAATALTNELDTAPEINAYNNNTTTYAIGRTYLASVTDDASLTIATTAANLQSVTEQIVAASQPPVTLVSAKSLKQHDGLPGYFEVPLDIAQPIGGAIKVEPRIGRNGHLVVFQFSGTIINEGTAQVIPVGSATAVKNGSTVEVRLTGIPDNQRVTVSLTGVNGNVSAAVSLGFLVGDVGGTGAVTAADIAALRAQSGSGVNTGNARFDLTTSGTIDAADVVAARARAGTQLP